MRIRWVLMGLVLGMAGCPAKICCTLDGDVVVEGEAECKAQGGASIALYVCDGVGDPDVDPDTDDTDQAVNETRETLCDDFCAAEQTACPSDVACLKSCNEECPTGPSRADVDCAELNADDTCDAFNQAGCWDFCS